MSGMHGAWCGITAQRHTRPGHAVRDRPQFVDADAPNKPLAFPLLGEIFDVNGTLWNRLVAFSSARLTRQLGPSEAFKEWFNRRVGSLLIGVGMRPAFARKCA